MPKTKRSRVAFFLTILTLFGGTASGSAQPMPAQPSPEAVAKLIAELDAADFRTREEASDKLAKLGAPVLPALRKAAIAKISLETKRRLEHVTSRIESSLFKAEEARWQDLDPPRRGIKDRLARIQARSPALSDQELITAIHLLALGRAPTDQEVVQVQKQLAEAHFRPAGVLQLTRSLLQGKESSAEVAAANSRLLKLQGDVAGEVQLKALMQLNSDEVQRIIAAVAADLGKAAKSDERFADLAYLVALSRFPRAAEVKAAVGHLQSRDRAVATENIVWALVNTREFMMDK